MSDEIRSAEELRGAIAILGASFIGPARTFIWGQAREEAMRAWAMFQALGWAVGADDSSFAITLEYVTLKLTEFTRHEEAKHAS
jgi:hypothetical protein